MTFLRATLNGFSVYKFDPSLQICTPFYDKLLWCSGYSCFIFILQHSNITK